MTTERTLLFPVSDETLKEIHPQWIFIRKAAMEGDVIGLQNEIKAMARVALGPRPELSGIRERKRIIAKILNEMNGIPEEQLE